MFNTCEDARAFKKRPKKEKTESADIRERSRHPDVSTLP